ncbi:MAG: GDP-mannose 4,6-dehydratase [Gemmataceae bacterium]
MFGFSRRGKPGEVYNFGGRCEKPNIELIHQLIDRLGKSRSLIRYVADRPGHDRRYAIDCTKAERELGWAPQMTFEEGLSATIRWYQENSAWVQAVKSGEYRTYYSKQYGELA